MKTNKKLFSSLLYLLLVVTFIFSSKLWALSLGEISASSYVNQRLAAKIPVHLSEPIERETIRVKIAPREKFNKLGLEYEAYLSDLRFQITEENQQLWIKIHSRKIIREPLLSFILQFNWPTGNLYKEYHLFLDPAPLIRKYAQTPSPKTATTENTSKTIRANTAQMARAPQTHKHKTPPKTADTATAREYRPDLSFEIQNYPSIREYGPVKSGESITLIAQKIRPDKTYSIQKIAKLLFQLNPQAFLNGNINNLTTGSRLKIPQLEIPELRKDKYAGLEQAEQATEKTESAQQTDKIQPAKTGKEANTDETETDAYLKIISADDTPANRQINDDRIAEAELKIAQLTEENHSLREQFSLLMARMDELIRKNDLLSQKIVQYEAALLKQQTLPGQDDNTTAQDNIVGVENAAEPADKVVSEKQKEKKPQDNSAKTAKPPHKAEKTQNQTETATEKSLFDLILDGSYWIAGALLSLLLLIGSFLGVKKYLQYRQTRNKPTEEFSLDSAWADSRQQKSEQDDSIILGDSDQPYDNDTAHEDSELPADTEETVQTKAADEELKVAEEDEEDIEEINFDLELNKTLADETDTPSANSEEILKEAIDAFEDDGQEYEIEDDFGLSLDDTDDDEDASISISDAESQFLENIEDETSETSSTADTVSKIDFNDILGVNQNNTPKPEVDVVSQASVYFAYGKFELAEKILIEAIQKNPQNHSYQLKLFECYTKMNDEGKFLELLEKVKSIYAQEPQYHQSVNDMYSKAWNKELP